MTGSDGLPLWHYTCDHAHLRIGAQGTLFPARMLMAADVDPAWPAHTWQAHLVWATDMERPNRDALGLTMRAVRCDRTTHRYRIDEHLQWWPKFRRRLLALHLDDDVDALESTPGARPAHWYVSPIPVPCTYDPVTAVRPGGAS